MNEFDAWCNKARHDCMGSQLDCKDCKVAFRAGMVAAAEIVKSGTNADPHSRHSLRMRLANLVTAKAEEIEP